MEKAVVYCERFHMSRNDENGSQGDQLQRPKSYSITIFSEQNGLEEKPSESDIDPLSKNRCNREEMLLNNESSLENEETANKSQVFSNNEIHLLKPSFQSLITLAKGKSPSTPSFEQPSSAKNWPYLERIQYDEPIRKYNSLVTIPNVENNWSLEAKPVNWLDDSTVCSRCCSDLSLASYNYLSGSSSSEIKYIDQIITLCKVCLNEIPVEKCWKFQQCRCSICIEVSKIET